MLLVALLLLLSSPKMLAGDLPFCSNANSVYIPNSTYMTNLRTLAETLIAKVTESHLHSATGTAGTGPDKIYGAVLCRGDSTGTDCTEHLNRVLDAAINNKASNSYTSRNNITLFDDWYPYRYQAQISFSDKDFLSSFSNAPECIVSANLNPPLDTVAEHKQFRKLVSELMGKLTEDAVRRLNRYSTGQGGFNEKSQTVYGLVQCTEDMPPEDCRSCLESIIPVMEQMVDDGQMGGAILGVRCNLWYQTNVQFFTATPMLSLHMPTPSRFWIWVTIGSFSLMVSISWLLVHIWIKTERKREQARFELRLLSMAIQNVINLWRIEEGSSGFSLYDFSQIKEATQNFSSENKLGQGGFGPVYKGVLPGGLEVAVKRLAACSVQDCVKGAQLNWSIRLQIIDGIAQGILYLHKHSRLCVVHRDLKASNILLDGDMTPKISDFGMARIFSSNMTESNTTRIVGTHGYISPEYAFDGVCSIKSDVFSFGVLVLEIISGKRTTGFYPYDGKLYNLISYAWQLWRVEECCELVCCRTGDNRQVIERCVQVALLCVQESADDRPTMDHVVTMLSSESVSLPKPKQPAYFHVRSSGPEVPPCNISISITLAR